MAGWVAGGWGGMFQEAAVRHEPHAQPDPEAALRRKPAGAKGGGVGWGWGRFCFLFFVWGWGRRVFFHGMGCFFPSDGMNRDTQTNNFRWFSCSCFTLTPGGFAAGSLGHMGVSQKAEAPFQGVQGAPKGNRPRGGHLFALRQVRRVVSNASVSVSGKMRKAQSDGSEVNVQQQRSGGDLGVFRGKRPG